MERTEMQIYQLAEQATIEGEPLLSRYSGAFWIPYLADNQTYDRLFTRLYESFKYRVRGKSLTVATMFSQFRNDVKSILAANSKKYNELFRLENLDDDVYNILDNYDLTETMERITGNQRTENIGSREDSDSTKHTGTNTVDNNGNTSAEYGEQSIDEMQSNPDITTTRENTVSAFDSDEYSPREKNTETIGNHAIDTVTTQDAHTDKTTITNTETETRNLSEDRTYKTGAQENSVNDNGSENYNLRRRGNIGVMTQSDVLLKHLELWDSYTFYQKIFADIADVLLYV